MFSRPRYREPVTTQLAPNNTGPKPWYLLPLDAKHYLQSPLSSPTKVYLVSSSSSIPEVHVFKSVRLAQIPHAKIALFYKIGSPGSSETPGTIYQSTRGWTPQISHPMHSWKDSAHYAWFGVVIARKTKTNLWPWDSLSTYQNAVRPCATYLPPPPPQTRKCYQHHHPAGLFVYVYLRVIIFIFYKLVMAKNSPYRGKLVGWLLCYAH
jgi:hypothetical protein